MKLKSKCLDGTIAAFVSIYKIWTKMPMWKNVEWYKWIELARTNI
jgi:hypothetical protein